MSQTVNEIHSKLLKMSKFVLIHRRVANSTDQMMS